MRKLMIILVILLIGSLFMLHSFYQKEKQARVRMENNLTTSLSEIKYYKTKNEELVAKVSGYEFRVKEFERLIPELKKEVTQLNIKLKNVKSVTQVVTEYKYINRDSVIYIPITDTTRLFKIDEKWIKAQVEITNCSYIMPGGFSIDSIPNSILTVPVVNYKGWWFWRRAIGVELHIKNSNPYVETRGATYIDLRK